MHISPLQLTKNKGKIIKNNNTRKAEREQQEINGPEGTEPTNRKRLKENDLREI